MGPGYNHTYPVLGAGAGGAECCGDGHASSGGEVPGEPAGVWGALVVHRGARGLYYLLRLIALLQHKRATYYTLGLH